MPRYRRCQKKNKSSDKKYIDPDDIFAVFTPTSLDPPDWYLELEKDPVRYNKFLEDLYNWCMRQDISDFNPRDIPESARFSKHFDKEIFDKTGRFVPLPDT